MRTEIGDARFVHTSRDTAARIYNDTIADRPSDFPISSARTWRLIFIEAVRGKSLSQITYPLTRLKSGNRRLRAEISSSNLLSNFWF